MQRKQTFHDDDLRWRESLRLRHARVRGEVVHRKLHCFPVAQSCYLCYKQLVLQRLRRVEVDPCPLLQRQVGEVTVIAIETEYLRLQHALEVLGQEALPCTGRPGNANKVGLSSHEQDSVAYGLSRNMTARLTLSLALVQIAFNLRHYCPQQ